MDRLDPLSENPPSILDEKISRELEPWEEELDDEVDEQNL